MAPPILTHATKYPIQAKPQISGDPTKADTQIRPYGPQPKAGSLPDPQGIRGDRQKELQSRLDETRRADLKIRLGRPRQADPQIRLRRANLLAGVGCHPAAENIRGDQMRVICTGARG